LISFGALALIAGIGSPLRAQATTQVQLAFGYECGDRFMVRNDGAQPVVVEYAVVGSQDRSTLHLDGRQSAEIASAQAGNLELWVGGKVVASEAKGNRACGASGSGQGNGSVAVRPLDQSAVPDANGQADTGYSAPPVVVYAQPDYSYYPYAYGGFYPYYPYYYPSFGFYAFGGYRGGFIRGGVPRVGGGGRVGIRGGVRR
jgi:hypothetical protein